MGGKFENGAITVAFSRMFNDLAHHDSRDPLSVGDPNPNAKRKLSYGSGVEITSAGGLPGDGGTAGINRQIINGEADDYYYTSSLGSTVGIAAGAAYEVNAAFGSGSWLGQFNTYSVNIGPFGASFFYSPDAAWIGFGASIGAGLPVGVSYTETFYCSVKNGC